MASTEIDAPATGAFSITASANALTVETRAIYVGGGGNITVTMKNGVSVTFSNVVAGTILPIRCTHVTAATATNLLGLH